LIRSAMLAIGGLSSWPGLLRPSRPCLLKLGETDVGARDRRGHDTVASLRRAATIGCGLLLFGSTATAQDFPPERIRAGAAIFSRNCSPCHGTRMQNPESAFDLRKFPPDQHDRFVSSVTRGKNQMPPWGDLLDAAEIESLWAYVMAGEPK